MRRATYLWAAKGTTKSTTFCKAGDGFCCASGAARQSSGIAEGGSVAPMGAVADVSKGKLPAPEGRQRG